MTENNLTIPADTKKHEDTSSRNEDTNNRNLHIKNDAKNDTKNYRQNDAKNDTKGDAKNDANADESYLFGYENKGNIIDCKKLEDLEKGIFRKTFIKDWQNLVKKRNVALKNCMLKIREKINDEVNMLENVHNEKVCMNKDDANINSNEINGENGKDMNNKNDNNNKPDDTNKQHQKRNTNTTSEEVVLGDEDHMVKRRKISKKDNIKPNNKDEIDVSQHPEILEIEKETKKLLKVDLSVIKSEDIDYFIAINYKDVYNESKMYVESAECLNVNFYDFDELNNETDNWLVALDCEMVKTENGIEIGRVTILQHNGNILYDKIIKPKSKIIGYLTQYSGLTKESYKSAITYEHMKNEIKEIIGKNTIILGHSLYNDLNILKIHHKKLIDTSFLYRCKDNRRVSLRNLAYKFLGKQIQQNTHCSSEDALICLELLALKIIEKHDYDSTEIKIDYGCEVRKCKISEYDKYKNTKGINYFFCTKEEYEQQNITNTYKTRFYMVFYKEKGKIKFLL
ncbi:hypothetical protein BDAP_001515 [Binucleata daphniae]